VKGSGNEKASDEQSFDGGFHVLRVWWLRDINENGSQYSISNKNDSHLVK
jgi:hypothetical protein